METQTKTINSIKLSQKKDNFGRYIPVINFNLTDFEKKQITSAQKILKNVSIRYGKKFNSIKYDKQNYSSGSHFSNTCRIGKNHLNSVVDKNLKFHSINNLFICDNSVLNYTGNSNPTFSLINLSFRLSDYLKSKYK